MPAPTAATLSPARLRRLLDAMERLDRDERDDWGHEPRAPLAVTPAFGRPRRTVFITKLGGLLGMQWGDIPDEVTLLSRFGVPSKPHAERVARECPSGKLFFVGDLDPLDLTVYVALASLLRPFGVTAHYVGVGSAWIARCRQNQSRRAVECWGIELSAFERNQLALLDALPLDWNAILGDDARAFLAGGLKLELEGATNPAFYANAHSRAITQLVFGARR